MKCYPDEVGKRGEIGVDANETAVAPTALCSLSGIEVPSPDPDRTFGCIGGENMQHVKWHSGTRLYEMFVPSMESSTFSREPAIPQPYPHQARSPSPI